MFTGCIYRYRYRSVQKHRDMRGEPGLTRYQHCSYRGERYPDHARAVARLGRACGCADGRVARAAADVRLIARGDALYWLVWAGNRTERLKEKQRLTSCDGAQELHVIIWLLAMYRGRLRGEARER